jgi:GNAT superfamily N-acetyltransferase
MSFSGIRWIESSDMDAVMRLKEAAGWNQTRQDWERLLELEPEGCFTLVEDGVLAATATAVTYGGDLAWIGMVLTLPEYRGRGFARRLMERVMAFTAGRGIRSVGLDATDMGIGLYRQFGFQAAGLVERWERPPGAAPVEPAHLSPWAPAADLDRAAFGADRSRILASLARLEAASIPGLGYAMGRPGTKAAYFGPSVARSAAAADCLERWFLARHPNEPVYQDILCSNREAARLASQYGFRPVRRLTRMFHGPVTPADESLVFAIASFAYG